MSVLAAREEPQTPEIVRQRYDSTVDGLNARWDLQLPRLYGRPDELVGKEDELALRCVGRIRYLCYRSLSILNGLIDDFEDHAKYIKSGWVLKPLQEAGTLPFKPRGRSKLFKDSLANPLRLTPEQRNELLQYLIGLLDEEFKLVRDSEVYERSAGGGPSKGLNQDSIARVRSPTRPKNNGFTTPTTSPVRRTNEPAVAGSANSTSAQRSQKRSPSPGVLQVCVSIPLHVTDELTDVRSWNRLPNVAPLQ
jgi:hypothetical protein